MDLVKLRWISLKSYCLTKLISNKNYFDEIPGWCVIIYGGTCLACDQLLLNRSLLGSHLRTKQIYVWQINDHKGGQAYQVIYKMKFWKELSKQ